MNPNFGSQLSTGLFFSEDEGIFGLLRFEIKQALDIFEPRIEINENDILIEGTDEGQIIVTLYFKVTKYQGNVFSTKVQM
jgi:phage baseplate assembly protein W